MGIIFFRENGHFHRVGHQRASAASPSMVIRPKPPCWSPVPYPESQNRGPKSIRSPVFTSRSSGLDVRVSFYGETSGPWDPKRGSGYAGVPPCNCCKPLAMQQGDDSCPGGHGSGVAGSSWHGMAGSRQGDAIATGGVAVVPCGTSAASGRAGHGLRHHDRMVTVRGGYCKGRKESCTFLSSRVDTRAGFRFKLPRPGQHRAASGLSRPPSASVRHGRERGIARLAPSLKPRG